MDAPRQVLAHAGRTMYRVKTTQAREEFGTMVNTVAYGGQWIVFERRDKDLAALIPMADLRRLQQVLETDGAHPGWDGLQPAAGAYDWSAAERIRQNLDTDYMH